MEEGISDIAGRHFIDDPATKSAEALALLYSDTGIDKDLNHIAFSFGQDKDDLRQILAMRLTKVGYVLRDLKGFKSWCHNTATHLCINGYKHEKVVRKYNNKCTGESVHCKRNGGAIVVYYPTVMTPEEQLLEEEQSLVQQSQMLQLEAKLRMMVNSFPPEKVLVARLFFAGEKSVKDIIAITGKSAPTVYRVLKEFEKALTKELGPDILSDGEMAAALHKVLAKSLRGD